MRPSRQLGVQTLSIFRRERAVRPVNVEKRLIERYSRKTNELPKHQKLLVCFLAMFYFQESTTSTSQINERNSLRLRGHLRTHNLGYRDRIKGQHLQATEPLRRKATGKSHRSSAHAVTRLQSPSYPERKNARAHSLGPEVCSAKGNKFYCPGGQLRLVLH
jgi:hypothetical protein